MKKSNQLNLLLKLHKLENNGEGVDKSKVFNRLEKRLDPSLVRRYHKLREKTGTGVAVMESRICSGCRMVYPESHEMLRYKNSIRNCEYCGRLLVVTDKSA